jgi:hypothetical protein
MNNTSIVLMDITNIVDTSGMEKTKAQIVLQNFQEFFDEASVWETKVKALSIANKHENDIVAPAREARLALKDVRVRAEKTKKALKENILIEGRFIDAIYNTIVAVTQPLEKKLEEQEKWREIEEQKRLTDLKGKREAELAPYGADTTYVRLEVMPEPEYQSFLQTSKLAHEARVEQAQKAQEAERARIEKERTERETLRKQNEEQALKLKAEREAKEKLEQELRVKAQAEAKAKADADAKAKAEAEAKAKAESAPDNEKIQAFLAQIQAIKSPTLTTEKAQLRLDKYMSEIYALTLELLNEVT